MKTQSCLISRFPANTSLFCVDMHSSAFTSALENLFRRNVLSAPAQDITASSRMGGYIPALPCGEPSYQTDSTLRPPFHQGCLKQEGLSSPTATYIRYCDTMGIQSYAYSRSAAYAMRYRVEHGLSLPSRTEQVQLYIRVFHRQNSQN